MKSIKKHEISDTFSKSILESGSQSLLPRPRPSSLEPNFDGNGSDVTNFRSLLLLLLFVILFYYYNSLATSPIQEQEITVRLVGTLVLTTGDTFHMRNSLVSTAVEHKLCASGIKVATIARYQLFSLYSRKKPHCKQIYPTIVRIDLLVLEIIFSQTIMNDINVEFQNLNISLAELHTGLEHFRSIEPLHRMLHNLIA